MLYAGVATAHLREEPQALLGERQRQRLIARRRQNRPASCCVRPDSAPRRPPPVPDWQTDRPAPAPRPVAGAPGTACAWPATNGRRVRRSCRDARPVRPATPRPRPVPGCCSSGVGRRHIDPTEQRLLRRCRQGLAVDLAVVVQRQDLELHPRASAPCIPAAVRAIARAVRRCPRIAIVRRVVRHQTRVVLAVAARQHHGFLDPGAVQQAIFDFSQLDAETANLHLIIVAADAIELPRRQPAREVAGAIEQRARLSR